LEEETMGKPSVAPTAVRKSKANAPQADPLLHEVTRARTALCLFDLNTGEYVSSPKARGALDLIADYLSDDDFRGYVKGMAIETLAKSLNEIERLRRDELKTAVA
jgi:hypothetical protein